MMSDQQNKIEKSLDEGGKTSTASMNAAFLEFLRKSVGLNIDGMPRSFEE